jgi:hypothetical protein
MNIRRSTVLFASLCVCLISARPAHATFHLTQIEQVIGGVNGDLTAQAIQLRLRQAGENLVGQGRINVRDAAGLNPILILDLTTNVTNNAAGDHVLITSPAFHLFVNPVRTADFTMANLIPASYLAAGSLTWEDDFGTIYWRVSWGGAGYTGSGTVQPFNNDADGNANPAFGGALPSTSFQALQFKNAAAAQSVTNAADYQVTAAASVWTNNARLSETVVGGPAGVGGGETVRDFELGPPVPNPTSGALSFTVALPREAPVRVIVFRANGERVRTVYDGDLPAGRRDLTWDGRDERGVRAASGAYYLRLESGAVHRSRKVMVVQ